MRRCQLSKFSSDRKRNGAGGQRQSHAWAQTFGNSSSIPHVKFGRDVQRNRVIEWIFIRENRLTAATSMNTRKRCLNDISTTWYFNNAFALFIVQFILTVNTSWNFNFIYNVQRHVAQLDYHQVALQQLFCLQFFICWYHDLFACLRTEVWKTINV